MPKETFSNCFSCLGLLGLIYLIKDVYKKFMIRITEVINWLESFQNLTVVMVNKPNFNINVLIHMRKKIIIWNHIILQLE